MKEVFGGARVVAVSVRSLDEARRFYVERLGFRVVKEEPGASVMVNLGTIRLCLDVSHAARRRGGTKLIFQTRNVAKTAAELDARGVAYEEHTGARVGNYVEVGDPDGNVIVFAERI